MRMRNLIFFVVVIFCSVHAYAQAPVIQKIEPESTFVNDTIVISGNGFNSDPAKLEVWFASVKGTIISSSDFSIQVVVPPSALLAPVEVINLESRLSGKSVRKFTPSFSEAPFDNTKFSSPLNFTSNEEFWDICTCDLNSDGKPDIATTKFKRTSPFVTPTDIMVLQNNTTAGTGAAPNALAFTKLDKTNLPVLNLTFPTDNIVCGDLQGDGKPELVVTRAGSPRNSIHIFKNTSTASINFATPVINLFMDVGHFATRMAIRDLNNDGKPEIIATNSFNDIFYIFINQSSGGNLSFNATPLKVSIKINSADVLTTYETDVQDFDGDKLPDILINQFQTNDIYILKNQSTGSVNFGAPQKITIQGAFNRLVSADFNKDGLLDLVATSTLNDRADVLINKSTTGTFAFGDPIVLNTSLEPWGVDIGDIDGDGDADIAIANRNRPTPVAEELKINIFINNGAATPSFTRSDIATSQQTRNVKIADVDGDAKADIVYTSFSESPVNSQLTILRNLNCHQPVILGDNSLTICNGQTIRLKAVPAPNVSYSWKESASVVGSNQPFLDITTPGAYTVTATGEGGACVLTSQTINVTADAAATPPDPAIIGGDLPICSGQTLNLSTSATADAYIWTGPSDFTSAKKNPDAIVASSESAGLYKLQIQVGNCKSNAIAKRIDVADLAGFAISSSSASNILCAGNPVSLSVNDLADFTFQWKKDGIAMTGETSSTIAATVSGSYSVTATPPATLNCSIIETEPVVLTFLTAPVAAYQLSEKGCVKETVTFNNQSQTDASGTVVYTWTFGDTQTSSDASPQHSYATAQTFSTSLNVKYAGVTGCENTASKSIIINSGVVPVITSSSESSCPEQKVTLSVQDGFSSVTWSSSETTKSISVLPGSYNVTTLDANNCTGKSDIIIKPLEIPSLTVSADPTTIPVGGIAQITASGAAQYSWTPGKTLSDSLASSPTATPAETTTYTLTGVSSGGCEAQIQLTITVDGVLSFPLAFSPNGDGQNDFWDIRAQSNPDCTITIFDGRGSRLFEGKGQNWDGMYNGKGAPEGTYYYVYSCPDKKPVTGNILLFR
jgi:gliding motility-associated-like protein